MSKPRLTSAQLKFARTVANERAQVISELLGMEGVPVDAISAAALMVLSIWNWEKSGKTRLEIARLLRACADNLEAGKIMQ